MQIHELNNFSGTLGSGAYLAVDDGNDTGKVSKTQLFAATEARIDNIIAGDAPSAAEIVDARLGADGVTYPSLGGAIRGQVTDLKSALSDLVNNRIVSLETVFNEYVKPDGSFDSYNGWDRTGYINVSNFESVTIFETAQSSYNAFYDENKTFLSKFSLAASTATTFAVPANAKYMVLSNTRAGLASLTGTYVLKSSVKLNQLKSELTQIALQSTNIPASFQSANNKCTLKLSDYIGKKAFVSNKNLLPQFPATTDHGVTCTKNSDGSITLSGTSNGTASFQLTASVMPTIGKGKYTLSARNPSAIGDNLTYINPSINGSYSATIACRLDSADAQTTFEIGENERIDAFRIRISSGVTFPSNYKLYPQLEEGETKTEFVAHDGSVIDLTASEIEADCFVGYNYVTAQVGVNGSVEYIDALSLGLNALDARVTALERLPIESKKFNDKKIVCFGDSLVGNFPAPLDYPSMIAEITGATVYNAGFGGCCMSDNGQERRLFTMCRLADSIVAGDFTDQEESGVSITYAGTSINYVPDRLAMLESIDWSDIDYIIIAYGTNDWNSNYGLDNESDSLDTTTYIGAFRYSVEKLLTAYPNLKIFVITPLWRWWDTNTGMPSEIHSDYIDSNDYAKGTGYKLWQYGDALADAAKLYHIPTFNLYWNCMMTKQNRLQYFNYNDGTHPKLEGRELMAELISAQLEAIY